MMRLAWDQAAAGRTGPAALLVVAMACYLVFGSRLCSEDFRSMILPDRLVVHLSWGTLAPLVGAAVWMQEPRRALLALAAGGGVGAIFLAAHLLAPSSLGFGDVKLAPSLGAFCAFVSLGHLLVAALVASLLAGLLAAVVMVAQRSLKAHLPLGPALIAGGAAAIVL